MFKNKKTILITLALVSGMVTNIATADFTFGTPVNLGLAINTSDRAQSPNISSDNLTLYFDSKRSGDWDIWVATRETTDGSWGEAVNLGPPVNGPNSEQGSRISADGLSLYFGSTRPGGYGDWDLWVATRETTDDSWGEPENLGPTVNSSVLDHSPSISADGLSLFFGSTRSGGSGSADLWLTTRETIYDNWGAPVNLGPTVNSSANEGVSSISADGRMLFFSSFLFGPPRPGGYGDFDIWVATRATDSDPWAAPVNLGPMVNSSFSEGAPDISADGSTLYFNSTRPGGSGHRDLWQVSIEPIVDLNADGIVDSADMCVIVDHWGTDEPLCDIGPMPWGDGIVDVEDLIVLAEHLFEQVGNEELSSIVIERRISASSDDAEEALNAGYTNWNDSSDLEITDDNIDNGGRQLIGMTFRNIDIAPGEVISNAYIEFTCDETKNGTDDAYFLIWGHLTPNPDGFIEPYLISNRTTTEAKVPWEPDPWDAVRQTIQTVDIAPIIQELIDQEGWVAGNAVEIIIGADPDMPAFTGVRCAESYDGSPSSAPLLHIEVVVP